jgi:hypothetical protein
MMRKRRHLVPRALARQLVMLVALVLTGGLALTACGSDSDEGGDTPSSTQDTKSIDITFEGDTVTPNGERVDVAIGQKVEFVVKADAPGEIHVHSSPEQEVKYEKGTTIVSIGSFDRAGIIEVESHALEKTIVQLQVQ